MFFLLQIQKNIINRLFLSIMILTPLISSCSSVNNKNVEIISPPNFPDKYSSIPDEIKIPQLNELSSAEQIIHTLRVGRKDPFLPPDFKSEQLLVPDSFKYHGQISSNEIANAFVSYQNRTGIISPGDIGGKHTDLLPPDWVMERVDFDTQELILSFDKSYLKIDLFEKS